MTFWQMVNSRWQKAYGILQTASCYGLYAITRCLASYMLFAIGYLLIAVCLSLMLDAPVLAAAAEDIQILKISPADERAVIKTPDGKMQVIKAGDIIKSNQQSAVSDQQKSKQQSAISDQQKSNQQSAVSSQKYELKVIEISKKRVVLEETTNGRKETVIIRLENGKQKVERIKKAADKQPEIYAPR